jgi:hypothetical protein
MLWMLAVVTTLVLAVIALMIRDISKPPTAASPAALSVSVRSTRHATPSAAHRPAASPLRRAASSASSASAPRKTSRRSRKIADSDSGLSYRLLSSPWRRGCPDQLNTPMFSWSAGEHAVAGTVSGSPWYGNACSGLLQQQFQYSGPADLELTAMSLAGAVDPAYYSGLEHYRTLEDSSAMLVSGHQAWEVTFQISYLDAAAQGLDFSSEAGAVVVVDRGAGQAPAVFYVSVPSDLGSSDVETLVGSLRLSA